jgi:RNA polymerase sigma factor (sigma-70 family)
MSECLAQKSRAWDELVRRFGPLVHGTVRKQLTRFGFASRKDLLEDAYQEVFLSLSRERALGRVADPEALPGYLAAMAVSKAVDMIRAVTREGAFAEWSAPDSREAEPGGDAAAQAAAGPEAELTCPRPNPRDEAQRRSLRDLVERELDDLTQREALIVRLKWQHDMTLEGIARMLDIPAGTAASVLRRAREKIRTRLTEKGIDE